MQVVLIMLATDFVQYWVHRAFHTFPFLWNFHAIHHWHHGSEREAIDINYASHFPIYDWFFGTHHLADKRWPETYGVVGDTVPRGYWRQFLYPFSARWRKTRAPQAHLTEPAE
ncbi:sterol desaturase family protein [Jannaschia aquimarina]|uniref:Fatty acid hydroxylase superfamily protein n=1 Tax=Jannaschia aquimarina TaxID=935700 RepID=A0A0D1EEQ0_9RHOB|nr:hypothetical protein [Jannaschia aquimarina]KIT15346.1 Fatty acid hydroxylase superfamily protein [Jannaschia aquimarina]SNS51740.1 Fatty acid hydroxylase superfamily protein [Jannaschia aquimarina]